MEDQTVNHPLFSCFITLFTLVLIYVPLQLLSPVLLLSCSLIISLLLLGSTQESISQPKKTENVSLKEEYEEEFRVLVEWDLRAPLEVIHEAYEDDDDDDDVSGLKDLTKFNEIDKFPFYPESDSGSGSGSDTEFNFSVMGDKWISLEKMELKWEEDEDDGGLIEIKLDEYNDKISKWKNQTEIDFHAEEEGLIEIDIFS